MSGGPARFHEEFFIDRINEAARSHGHRGLSDAEKRFVIAPAFASEDAYLEAFGTGDDAAERFRRFSELCMALLDYSYQDMIGVDVAPVVRADGTPLTEDQRRRRKLIEDDFLERYGRRSLSQRDISDAVDWWKENNRGLYSTSNSMLSGLVQNWYLEKGRPSADGNSGRDLEVAAAKSAIKQGCGLGAILALPMYLAAIPFACQRLVRSRNQGGIKRWRKH